MYDLPLFFNGPERQRALTVWVASAATQTAGTLLIMYRELSTPKYVAMGKTPRYCPLAAVACAVIDSGATYTLGIIFTLALYACKKAEGAIISAVLGQIAVRGMMIPGWLSLCADRVLGNRPADDHLA